MKWRRQPYTLAFALLTAGLVLLSAYCTDRDGGSYGGDFDELVLQNPAYMLARFGKLTMPIAPFETGLDQPLISHPPIHVGLIGLLMKLGVSIYYAEATPTVLLLVLTLAAILTARFGTPVKLGLLFSIGFLASSGETLALCFGTRPEGEVHAAWLLGLVLLESARAEHWNRFRLFAGAFFLTWASGTHYYAAIAFTGVTVYGVWIVRTLGWQQGRSRIAVLCAGGCLFGIPYLTLFLIPSVHRIETMVVAMQGPSGIGFSLRQHLDLYRSWAASPDHHGLVRAAMATGLPLVVFSTAILGTIRQTRALALAALPLQVFLLLFCRHQAPFYLVHEAVLLVTAVAIGLLLIVERIGVQFWPPLARYFEPAAAAALAAGLLWGSPMLAHADISLRPKVHEVVLARAASRQILGPQARVSGRSGAWYASGAGHWLDIERATVPNSLLFDPRTYFANLDAAVNYLNNSDGPITSWYADGTLQLRGFFFGETSGQLRLVYLTPRRTPQVVGYTVRRGALYRFEEDEKGDQMVLAAVCGPDYMPWLWPWRATSSSILRFPAGSPDAARTLVTILAPRRSVAPDGEIGRGCREVSRTAGTLRPADRGSLLGELLKDDPPMQFHSILDEMPGYAGMGLPPSATPPAGTTPVEGVLDLSKAIPAGTGRVERTGGLRVATAPGLGSFSALIPVSHTESFDRCWVALRLRVLSGHIGFAAYDSRKGLIARTPGIAGSPAPQSVALEVPSLATATHIVIFNESTLPSGGLVDILDAAVLVKQ